MARGSSYAPRPRPLLLAAGALAVALLAAGVAVGAGRLLQAARSPAPAAGPRPPLVAGYRLQAAGRPAVRVRLEVAADPAARAKGLMGRQELPAGTGMVFLFPADVREAFWMKDTLLPLSIAFVAADGRVVDVQEMTPCRQDPCRSYPPAGPYRYAVELPAGALRAAGVGPGDLVRPEAPGSLPDAA